MLGAETFHLNENWVGRARLTAGFPQTDAVLNAALARCLVLELVMKV